VGVSDELTAIWNGTAPTFPRLRAVRPAQRPGAVPTQGSYIKQALQGTQTASLRATPHVPGKDYAGYDEMLVELELMRSSLTPMTAPDRDGTVCETVRPLLEPSACT